MTFYRQERTAGKSASRLGTSPSGQRVIHFHFRLADDRPILSAQIDGDPAS
jgi:hypothetical protein